MLLPRSPPRSLCRVFWSQLHEQLEGGHSEHCCWAQHTHANPCPFCQRPAWENKTKSKRGGCKSFSNSQAQTIMLWRTQPLQCIQKDADALADDVQLPCSQAKQLSFFRACQGSLCKTGKKVKTEGWFASLYLFSKSTISSSKHLFSKSTISFSKTNPISKSTPGSDAIAWSSLCCQPAE